MKHDKLSQALDQISDQHIAEAAAPEKRHFLRWTAPIAAVVALAIVIGILAIPITQPPAQAPGVSDAQHSAHLLSAPVYPTMSPYPDEGELYKNGHTDEAYRAFDLAHSNWKADRAAQYDQPEGYADGTEGFFAQTMEQLLGGQQDNKVCSPVNIYMALAMLAETASGESRQQILDALGADSIERLRTQADHIWNAHYCADNATYLTLANSLWLDTDLSYDPAVTRLLSDRYYASVFRGDLGSEEMNGLLRSWLNEQTGGLLEEQAQGIEMDPLTIMALSSTIYYRCKWSSEFWERANTEGLFHSPQGDRSVTYMNTSQDLGRYYWGDKFGAVSHGLEDGSRMWLVLPDESYTPEQLLTDPQVLELLQSDSYANQKELKVNLSLPKFDICSDLDLKQSLQAMGITQVFTPEADFSAILGQEGNLVLDPFLSEAKHAARVAIDEEGITAAAYTVMLVCGSGMPLGEEIDFVLDRPFLFVVESRDGLPLFAGIVNQP